jgi:RNA-directed DNA polymerase
LIFDILAVKGAVGMPVPKPQYQIRKEVVFVAQQLDIPKTETELRAFLDYLYSNSKKVKENGKHPKFFNLMEVVGSETTILTAVHNIQSNKGSNTPGLDGQTIDNIIGKDFPTVITMVQMALKDYRPLPVRRVLIPKPGKGEKRPLGIPPIIDRVIQECVRIVCEPICEAQFFNHSYGFRPMRGADMALARLQHIVHDTGYHWALEGDISKYFDTINHRKLINKLWDMGICDRRVLVIITRMLKAGIMNETAVNPMGTQQGAIISPLLANVYLNSFDWWISNYWATKETRYQYADQHTKITALKRTKLLPAYLIRYADDWVLVTDTKEHAEKWKERVSKYLDEKLHLQLSQEKTVITNIRKKPVHFLGFEYKVVKGKARTGYITKTQPDAQRLKGKVRELRKEIRALRKEPDRNMLVHKINLINSKIRGMLEYYKCTTHVNMAMRKYTYTLKITGYCSLRSQGVKWIPAKSVDNLLAVHAGRQTQIPAIEHERVKIGLTLLSFVNWKSAQPKNPSETPYSVEGRTRYFNRTGKMALHARADQLLSLSLSKYIALGLTNKIYNFEFLLNRAYAYNRDKGKCRVCGIELLPHEVETHHIEPTLSIEQVNKVGNLATQHVFCHQSLVHSTTDLSHLDKKVANKVIGFRNKLN